MSVCVTQVVVLKPATTLLEVFHVVAIVAMNYLLITRVAMVRWCTILLIN